MTPLLHANGLVRDYNDPPTRTRKRILHGIDLHVAPGESLGIIGESGSGKSTLARILMGLEPPDEGTVSFRGADLFGPARRALRPHIQAVFQDPYGSLEPLITLGERRAARQARVAGALEAVNLPADAARKYPHAFSGGQRQRIAIARALITRPALLIADEPVSALDVSVQAQVLNLLLDLRTRLGLACVFISHDLAVIRHVAQRVLVLQAGRIVEQGETAALLRNPAHPFTRSLIDAMPASPVRA
jgi:peptide/nickel transport system ATP-binding protein